MELYNYDILKAQPVYLDGWTIQSELNLNKSVFKNKWKHRNKKNGVKDTRYKKLM